MKAYTFKCPNCGSPINLDYDNPQSFCGNCGTKIILDISQMQEFLIEKERTKLEQERTRQKAEQTKQAIEKTKQTEEENRTKALILCGVIVVGYLAFNLFLLIIWYFSNNT